MNIKIKNNKPGIRSYLNGVVTVQEGSFTIIPRDLNCIIIGDAMLLYDVNTSGVIINNGVADLNSGGAVRLFETLAQFANDKLATLFLYYSLPVNIRQTELTPIETTVWSITNPISATMSFIIESIDFNLSFDSTTPQVASLLRYELVTFKNAIPSSGVIINPNKSSKISPDSVLDIRYLNTGLDVTGVIFDSPFAFPSCPAVRGASSVYQRKTVCLKLAPGEGLAIRVSGGNALVGQSICGEIGGSLR